MKNYWFKANMKNKYWSVVSYYHKKWWWTQSTHTSLEV